MQTLRQHRAEAAACKRHSKPGDIRHSIAEITKARHLLGFEPARQLAAGLELAIKSYLRDLGRVLSPGTYRQMEQKSGVESGYRTAWRVHPRCTILHGIK